MSDKPKIEVHERTADGSWGRPAKQEPAGEVYEFFKALWDRKETTGLGEAVEALTGLKYEGSRYGEDDGYDLFANTVEEGLAALNVPKLSWWNPKQLCFVISDGETKVGFGSSKLKVPFQGLHWARCDALVEGLRQRMTVH